MQEFPHGKAPQSRVYFSAVGRFGKTGADRFSGSFFCLLLFFLFPVFVQVQLECEELPNKDLKITPVGKDNLPEVLMGITNVHKEYKYVGSTYYCMPVPEAYVHTYEYGVAATAKRWLPQLFHFSLSFGLCLLPPLRVSACKRTRRTVWLCILVHFIHLAWYGRTRGLTFHYST